MHFDVRNNLLGRSRLLVMCLVTFPLLQLGCGPEDYQKPIQQFQDASNVVINTTHVFLNNMNLIEQNGRLDNVVFQREKLDLAELAKVEIISPEEIRIRTEALEALTQYTSNLAELVQNKVGSTVGDNTDLTGDFCTSGSEREFTLKERWYANQEIQAGAGCDAAAAD